LKNSLAIRKHQSPRVETLKRAVKTVAFKIYRVNLESGSVEVSTPKEYKPRAKKS